MTIQISGDLAAIITAVTALIGMLSTVILQFLNLRQSKKNTGLAEKNASLVALNAEKIDANTQLTKDVRDATDGLTDKLVEATKVSSHAQGVKDEKASVGLHPVPNFPDVVKVQLVAEHADTVIESKAQ